MPIFPMAYKQRVVALGKDKPGGGRSWIGTGFFYGYRPPANHYIPHQEPAEYEVYLVTNKHVFGELKTCYVKWTPPGADAALEIPVELRNDAGDPLWHGHHNENVDVAVISAEGVPFVNAAGDDLDLPHFCSDVDVARRVTLNDRNVCEGDNVFMLGYPMGMAGPDTNTVIVRGGCVAEITKARVGDFDLLLIDSRVLGGNSGSPVVLPPIPGDGDAPPSPAYLIGVAASSLMSEDQAEMTRFVRMRILLQIPSGLCSTYLVDTIDQTIQAIP